MNRWPCMQGFRAPCIRASSRDALICCTSAVCNSTHPALLHLPSLHLQTFHSKTELNSGLPSHSHVPRASTCYRAADYSYREESIDKAQASWGCPKCRTAYQPSEVPSEYRCFCGKQRDPPLDPWLAPHTCGDICGRELASGCGHTCVLLCHPGPCPPCPRQVSICPVPCSHTPD